MAKDFESARNASPDRDRGPAAARADNGSPSLAAINGSLLKATNPHGATLRDAAHVRGDAWPGGVVLESDVDDGACIPVIRTRDVVAFQRQMDAYARHVDAPLNRTLAFYDPVAERMDLEIQVKIDPVRVPMWIGSEVVKDNVGPILHREHAGPASERIAPRLTLREVKERDAERRIAKARAAEQLQPAQSGDATLKRSGDALDGIRRTDGDQATTTQPPPQPPRKGALRQALEDQEKKWALARQLRAEAASTARDGNAVATPGSVAVAAPAKTERITEAKLDTTKRDAEVPELRETRDRPRNFILRLIDRLLHRSPK